MIGRLLSTLIAIPLALLFVVFAISNRDLMTLALWPINYTLTLPIYLFGLGALFVGFVAGGLVAWSAGGRQRRRARTLASKNDWLEWEVRDLKRRMQRSAERERAQRAAPALAAAPEAETQPKRALVEAG